MELKTSQTIELMKFCIYIYIYINITYRYIYIIYIYVYIFQLAPKIKKYQRRNNKTCVRVDMSGETANQDIENTANNVKNLEEAMAVVKKMEKNIRSNKYCTFWLVYQQV